MLRGCYSQACRNHGCCRLFSMVSESARKAIRGSLLCCRACVMSQVSGASGVGYRGGLPESEVGFRPCGHIWQSGRGIAVRARERTAVTPRLAAFLQRLVALCLTHRHPPLPSCPVCAVPSISQLRVVCSCTSHLRVWLLPTQLTGGLVGSRALRRPDRKCEAQSVRSLVLRASPNKPADLETSVHFDSSSRAQSWR